MLSLNVKKVSLKMATSNSLKRLCRYLKDECDIKNKKEFHLWKQDIQTCFVVVVLVCFLPLFFPLSKAVLDSLSSREFSKIHLLTLWYGMKRQGIWEVIR